MVTKEDGNVSNTNANLPATPAGAGPDLYVPAVFQDPSQMDAVIATAHENLAGIEISFPRVKMPSGGALSFNVPGDDKDKLEPASELIGVIMDRTLVNAYWHQKYSAGSTGNSPDCIAVGGEIGEGTPGGKCAQCSLNQWGSARDDAGNPTDGKACRNLHVIYLLQKDSIFPLKIVLPPSSLGSFHHYLVALTGRVKPLHGVVTRIGLATDKNRGGITYSHATFSMIGELPANVVANILDYRNQMRNFTQMAAAIQIQEEPLEAGEGEADDQPF